MASSKVAVTMLGARMHYAVPVIMHSAGLLDRFFTDSYVGNKPALMTALRLLQKAGVGKTATQWLGRQHAEIPPQLVTSFETLGLRYALARRRASGSDAMEKVFVDTNRQFANKILSQGLGSAEAVWGFCSASLEIFKKANAEGRTCILEQATLPRVLMNRMLRDVANEWQGWQDVPSTPIKSSIIAQREFEEWELADLIVAASDFVADGLIECGVSANKIRIVPYGVKTNLFPIQSETRSSDGPLRVLFAGEVGLRKGVPYLLEALRELGPEKVCARFAGNVLLNRIKLDSYQDVAEFLGAVPRSEMRNLYQWAQVFVLPSIAEGSATVSYEAIMSGLPVVATYNSGTIVRNGVEGTIVPAMDSDAIINALENYRQNRELLAEHAKSATAARHRMDLSRYSDDLLNVLKEFL